MDYCSMVKEEGLLKLTSANPDEWADRVPDGRPVPRIQMASVLENQCVTFQELAEAYDAERWDK